MSTGTGCRNGWSAFQRQRQIAALGVGEIGYGAARALSATAAFRTARRPSRAPPPASARCPPPCGCQVRPVRAAHSPAASAGPVRRNTLSADGLPVPLHWAGNCLAHPDHAGEGWSSPSLPLCFQKPAPTGSFSRGPRCCSCHVLTTSSSATRLQFRQRFCCWSGEKQIRPTGAAGALAAHQRIVTLRCVRGVSHQGRKVVG